MSKGRVTTDDDEVVVDSEPDGHRKGHDNDATKDNGDTTKHHNHNDNNATKHHDQMIRKGECDGQQRET